MKEFVEFYLANVKTLATEVKYVPLADPAYQMATDRLQARLDQALAASLKWDLPIEELLEANA